MDADNDCVSSVDPCVNVAFDFIRGDTTPARLVSTTFQLSSNLELCGSLGSSIHNVNGSGGAWLGAGFNGNFNAYADGPGTYTVDVAVLGLPCGPTNSGTLFTVDVKKTTGFPDGTGTITITNVVVRDCLNAPLPGSPGAAASLTLDAAGPSSIANLAAPQRKTGNAAGSTTDIQVNFSAPGDASVVEVYRAPFGNYPEYDDPPTPGSVPSAPSYPPGSPWTLTAVTTSGQYDHPSTRDFWYYVVFTKDACGNVSSVSNRTNGTLNYHLGDVSNGGTPCLGDNLVGTADISLLGAHYGIPTPPGFECLDVGPTTDFSVNGRPTTDNLIGFEDLILFAINYGAVSFTNEHTVESASATAPQLRFVLDPVQVAGRQSGRLFLDGNDARVKGVHAGLRFDPLAVTGLEVVAGSLLEAQSSEVFFRTPSEPKLLWIDAVVLGTDRTMHGSGEIARVSWTSSSPRVRPELAGFDLRDRDNRSLTSTAGATSRAAERPNLLDRSTPSVSGLESVRWLGARPNPFPRSTELHFALGAEAEVDVTIFDLAGRRVRSLSSGPMDAGDHTLTWDGRDDQGRATGAAVYLVRLTAGGQVESHKLYRYR